MQLLGRKHIVLLLLFPSCWNSDEMTGASGAILDHEVILRMEAICGRAKR